MPKVSVILPCYNQGKYLKESVKSVLDQTYSDYEIIVVNDGSDDIVTQDILSDFSYPHTIVVHTENQGLASARNNGIAVATGEYILPLDADDRIGKEYIEKAVVVMDANPDIGIVYCKARLFGALNTEWLLPDYSLAEMLKDNVIFCTALFRRSDWEDVGGYDPGMVYGWEDYDFWLSLIERRREVHQISESLFFYRVASDSMVRSKEKWQKVAMFKRIYERHRELFGDNIEIWIEALLDARERYFTSRLYIDCGEGVRDESSISRKVDQGTSEITFEMAGFDSIRNIRFDPVDAPAVVELLEVCITCNDGSKKQIFVQADNSLFHIGNDRYFGDNDPQCFFKVKHSDLDGMKSLQVKTSFKALGSDALALIVGEQQNLLEDSRKVRRGGESRLINSFLAILRKGSPPAKRERPK